ncbi:hypothetical protein [Desulfovibrio sp. Fe33]|uniref:hypothetical protein n=1 Tax=Desulfovibrio sp. Fe33 TaxID=3020842 RepID=UPI00234CAB17|nr:hypothetical protein [Desulfovibrio sp. Fe33]
MEKKNFYLPKTSAHQQTHFGSSAILMGCLDGEDFHVLAPNLLFFVTATREVVFRRFGLIAQRFRSPSVVAEKAALGLIGFRIGAARQAPRTHDPEPSAGAMRADATRKSALPESWPAPQKNGVKAVENSLNLRDDLCHKNSWN